jgi:hypothetical protein
MGFEFPWQHDLRLAVRSDLREARAEFLAARRARVRALWPTMSIRDIAIELGATVSGVQVDAKLLGLGSRPIARQP